MNQPSISKNRRYWILLAVAALAIAAMVIIDPIAQNPVYHNFADSRGWLSISNFGNVASNLPFAVVGLLGLMHLLGHSKTTVAAAQRPAYLIFFGGVLLVCFGSGYYHLAPDNTRLVWDRLPMTLAFMGLFSAIVGERISARWGQRLLWPLVFVGLSSVLYWHHTEQQGHGDLRPYALIQFLPMLLLPLIVWLFPGHYCDLPYLLALLACYALSKATEHWDEQIYQQLNAISGHSIKHLAAATGVFCFYSGLKHRVRRNELIKH